MRYSRFFISLLASTLILSAAGCYSQKPGEQPEQPQQESPAPPAEQPGPAPEGGAQ